jgi:hypothetical protein
MHGWGFIATGKIKLLIVSKGKRTHCFANIQQLTLT